MNFTFTIIGVLLGLLISPLGIIVHNYEVNKCSVVSQNQYYEAKADCYMPLERPNWNLFWSIFGILIIGVSTLGFIGFGIDLGRDF